MMVSAHRLLLAALLAGLVLGIALPAAAAPPIGDIINIEIDPQTQAIVETAERVLAERGTVA